MASLSRRSASIGAILAVLAWNAFGGRLHGAEPAASVVPSSATSVAPSKATTDAKETSPKSEVKGRKWQVIFVIEKNSTRCDEELKRLQAADGDFEAMKKVGWRIGPDEDSDIRVVDREQIPELVAKLKVKVYPTVAGVEKGEIVRSFTSGCTTPLDCWTFYFLASGENKRPPGTVSEAAKVETTGHYQLRGNHWSVDGDFSPTRETVLEHLHGPNHAWELPYLVAADSHIEQWSYEELRSLHDDLHEKYGPASATDAPAADTNSVQSVRAKYKGG